MLNILSSENIIYVLIKKINKNVHNVDNGYDRYSS